jgi:dolichol-phosphate mannosyltransferase
MGVGSAHREGFVWSYKKNYKIIITMDGDKTHDPKYIKHLIEKLKNFDVVITNRFLEENSLKDWPLFRIFLTKLRHLVISLLLSMPYDSSGAFRCINCRTVVLSDLILAKKDGYEYLWESIFILHKKKYRIGQIPIHLPFRNYGSSKMVMKDILFSIYYLIIVFLKKILGQYNFK